MKTCLKLMQLVVLSAVVAGCSSAGGDVEDAVPGSTAAIAGLWNFSTNDDTDYREYSADGTAIIWDYDGDAAGDGDNCYYKVGPTPIVNKGNDVYEGFDGTVTATVDGDNLTITSSDGTIVYPRLLGLSTADFNICGR